MGKGRLLTVLDLRTLGFVMFYLFVLLLVSLAGLRLQGVLNVEFSMLNFECRY